MSRQTCIFCLFSRPSSVLADRAPNDKDACDLALITIFSMVGENAANRRGLASKERGRFRTAKMRCSGTSCVCSRIPHRPEWRPVLRA